MPSGAALVVAPGVRVPAAEAEAVRRRLHELGVLRLDLRPRHEDGHVVFPVSESCGPRLATVPHEFEARGKRPTSYVDLLPEGDRAAAPRAFDEMGDIAVVKVPPHLWERRDAIGDALLRFRGCRAVFHDHGVDGPFRVRRLERIAGRGGSATVVAEHGIHLHVDVARAYFSPRLADERARIVAQLRPGDRLIDLFGGVAPLGVHAARAGAHVDSVDLNPEAVAMARLNVERNGVRDRVHVFLGDARRVAPRLPPAQHVVLNLPHEAKGFLDVAVPLVAVGGTLHHHEILEDAAVPARGRELVAQVARSGRAARLARVRHVRNYATGVSHHAFDVEVS